MVLSINVLRLGYFSGILLRFDRSCKKTQTFRLYWFSLFPLLYCSLHDYEYSNNDR